MTVIVPCAGESSRMSYVPKSMIIVNGKPLISHVTDLWKDETFIFVLRKNATYFWELLPKNSAVVFQEKPSGLANAILLAESYAHGRLVINLGDCVCKGAFVPLYEGEIGIGVWPTDDVAEYRKSYSVEVDGNHITKVLEKPKTIPTQRPLLCGMGVYFLDDRVFEYIKQVKVKPSGGDFTEVLQAMIDDGRALRPVWFDGKYVNVGSPADVEKAEEALK
jgi:dTDP-glucose pyrophosphorylase